jgi:hypothetical protein
MNFVNFPRTLTLVELLEPKWENDTFLQNVTTFSPADRLLEHPKKWSYRGFLRGGD